MLEGKELILATKPYAKDDRSKSWWATLSTLVLLAISVFGTLYPFHIGVRIACSFFQALFMVRMFVIYHDFLHRAILRRSVAANIIFTFLGMYMLTPRSIWKRSHDYHHKHNSKLFTSAIGSFPIVTKKKYKAFSKRARANYLFVRHPITIAFGYVFAFAWGMCLLPLFRSPTKHWDSATALLFHFGIHTMIYLTFGLTASLLVFIPIFLTLGLGSYLFYAQHNFPGSTFQDKQGWSYIGAAMNSSSYMKMNKVLHWFSANIGYHHVHHANARIPFYRLPEVYEAIPEFQAAKTTSLSPVDVWKCLRLKVWDPEAGKMLTAKELKAAVD